LSIHVHVPDEGYFQKSTVHITLDTYFWVFFSFVYYELTKMDKHSI
jgi:hypothetical protein